MFSKILESAAVVDVLCYLDACHVWYCVSIVLYSIYRNLLNYID